MPNRNRSEVNLTKPYAHIGMLDKAVKVLLCTTLYVFQNHIATLPLRQPMTDLLADDIASIRYQTSEIRIGVGNDFDRHSYFGHVSQRVLTPSLITSLPPVKPFSSLKAHIEPTLLTRRPSDVTYSSTRGDPLPTKASAIPRSSFDGPRARLRSDMVVLCSLSSRSIFLMSYRDSDKKRSTFAGGGTGPIVDAGGTVGTVAATGVIACCDGGVISFGGAIVTARGGALLFCRFRTDGESGS